MGPCRQEAAPSSLEPGREKEVSGFSYHQAREGSGAGLFSPIVSVERTTVQLVFLLSEIGGELVAAACFLQLCCITVELALNSGGLMLPMVRPSVPQAGSVGRGGSRLQIPSLLVLKLCQANAQSFPLPGIQSLFLGLVGRVKWHWFWAWLMQAEWPGCRGSMESLPHNPLHWSRFACNIWCLLAVPSLTEVKSLKYCRLLLFNDPFFLLHHWCCGFRGGSLCSTSPDGTAAGHSLVLPGSKSSAPQDHAGLLRVCGQDAVVAPASFQTAFSDLSVAPSLLKACSVLWDLTTTGVCPGSMND